MPLQNLEIYVIHSPHFPSSYANNINCSWVFTASEEGYFIIMSGRILDIDEYDSLLIGNSSHITNSSFVYQYPNRKKYAPYRLMFDSMAIWVLFASDKLVTSSGFYLTVERNIEKGKVYD